MGIQDLPSKSEIEVNSRGNKPNHKFVIQTERKKSSSMGDNGPEPVSTDCNKKLAIAAFVLAMIDFFIFFIILVASEWGWYTLLFLIGFGCSIAAFVMIYVSPKCICAIFTCALIGIIICGIYLVYFIYAIVYAFALVGSTMDNRRVRHG